jgi:hypothetical protein
MTREERRSRARERLAEAHEILAELDLIARWRRYGEPVVVGSVALGLVVRPDIDIEIHAETPTVRDGFAVVVEVADLPSVRGVRFLDVRDRRERGMYWKLEYERAHDQRWTIDMWLFAADSPASQARGSCAAINAALTDETRDTILAIKEEALSLGERAHGHWLYRAVLNEGVRTYADYQEWIGDQDVWERVHWQPRPAPSG